MPISHPNNAKITKNSIPATLPTYTNHPILSSLSIVFIMHGLLSRQVVSSDCNLFWFKILFLKSIADQFQLLPWRSGCFFDSGVNLN